MGKKIVSVAYEDPRFSKKEALYFSHVRRALDEMGAPNSGELLHNSKAYVEGVFKAGVTPLEAAAVIWHQHCGKAGQEKTPCVAEDRERLAAFDPWALVEPGFWEWRTTKYPPGGYAIAQLPRKKGFELGRWDSKIGRVSFRAIAIYPSLESAQAGATVYAQMPGGMEANDISLTTKRIPGLWYIERKKNGQITHLYGPWHSEQAALGGRANLERARRTDDGSVLTLPLLAVGVVPGVQECPCETEAACPPNAGEKEKKPVRVIFSPLQNQYLVLVGWNTVDSYPDHEDAEKARKKIEKEMAGDISEANDSAACVPFTRLERNNEAFRACQAIAKGPLEDDRAMFRLLSSQLGKEDQEVFVVVGLDLHRNLRSYTEIARGQRDRVAVNVEDVVRAVIADGPHGFVVAHNHPSGKANPSPKDKELTDRIRAAAQIACPSVAFLDHIVVGQGEYYCFADGKLKRA